MPLQPVVMRHQALLPGRRGDKKSASQIAMYTRHTTTNRDVSQRRAVKSLLLSLLVGAFREAVSKNNEQRQAAILWLREPIAQRILTEVAGVPSRHRLVDLLPKIKSGEFRLPRLAD